MIALIFGLLGFGISSVIFAILLGLWIQGIIGVIALVIAVVIFRMSSVT